MQGRVVVMTGATSGIGEVAAEDLARRGARIVFVARDGRRAEQTMASLRGANPDADHKVHWGDLSLLADMKRVGDEIAAAEPRIDVLVNNAGAMFGERHETPDGLERTFALNHMSYFVLTLALRDRLRASAPSRIVSTASLAHRGQALDFDDLQLKAYGEGAAYGRSKLANILFTRELARRLAGTNVTANCLHPGFVATKFAENTGGWYGLLLRGLMVFARTPERGAQTITYLASSPDVEGVSGEYFADCRIRTPSRAAQDDAAAARLWTESEKIAGVQW